MNRKTVITLLVGVVINASPAFAEDAETAAKIKALEEKVARLERLLEAKAQEAPAAAKPAVAKEDIQVALTPGLKVSNADGSTYLKLRGRMQADSVWYQDDKSDYSDGAEMRRVQLGVGGLYNNEWAYLLDADVLDGIIVDAYVSYQGIKEYALTAGNFFEPFGLEATSGNLNTLFLENSAPTLAFTPGRNVGASAKRHGENWSTELGLYGRNANDADSTDDEGYSYTGRVHYAPLHENDTILHLGAATRWRSVGQGNTLSFSAKPEVNHAGHTLSDGTTTKTKAVDTGTIANADHFISTGLEGIAAWNSVGLVSEYYTVDVERTALTDLNFGGGYVTASWFLTGEPFPYDPKSGKITGVKPLSPFDSSKGGTGAWQLTSRYSHLDLNDGTVTGGEMDNISLGLSWYPNSNVKMMTNYIMVDTDSEAVQADDDPEIYLFRAQFNF